MKIAPVSHTPINNKLATIANVGITMMYMLLDKYWATVLKIAMPSLIAFQQKQTETNRKHDKAHSTYEM